MAPPTQTPPLIHNICSQRSTNPSGFSPGRIFQQGLETSLTGTTISPAASFSISPLFLYDVQGLSIFDEITRVSEYYLTEAERAILVQYGDRLAEWIPDNARVVELGAGSMTKTAILLEAVMKRFHQKQQEGKAKGTGPIYQAVDVCYSSLAASLRDLATRVPEMTLEGLCGTYDDAVDYLRREANAAVAMGLERRPLVLLWLGSSIGNMTRDEAVEFMTNFRRSVFMPGDLWMVGIDGRNWDPHRAWTAYNDSFGVSRNFILNGLVNINRILVESSGGDVSPSKNRGAAALLDSYRDQPFPVDKFEFIGVYNQVEGRHEAYLEAKEDMTIKFLFNLHKFDALLNQQWNASNSCDVVMGVTPARRVSDDGHNSGVDSGTESSSRDEDREDEAVQNVEEDAVSESFVTIVKHLQAGEKIHMEYSYKYSPGEIETLFDSVYLSLVEHLVNPSEPYHFVIGQEMPFWFARKSQKSAAAVDPTLAEWEELWSSWDYVTSLIKPAHRLYKPIALRHPFLFYLGHIPAFLDHHFIAHVSPDLEREAGLPKRQVPSTINTNNFLRGIDPDMVDPTSCHNHSELPDIWPSFEALNIFRGNVRDRVRALLRAADDKSCLLQQPVVIPLSLRKALWMAFEHEAMHLETILYMMAQCPPQMLHPLPIQRRVAINTISSLNCKNMGSLEFQRIPGGIVTLGRSHLEDGRGDLGWDNEYPQIQVNVPSFHMQRSNVTVQDYVEFLIREQENCGSSCEDLVPVSWIHEARGPAGNVALSPFNIDHFAVRTLYGPVPLQDVLQWPVLVSGHQAEYYAASKGWRLPTEAEWVFVRQNQASDMGQALERQLAEAKEEIVTRILSVHHGGNNTGFKHWSPVDVSPICDANTTLQDARVVDKIYDMVGSGWEWTHTTFGPLADQVKKAEQSLDGKSFVPQEGYPDYSQDFFDGKHWVVLGGSWATHPRLSDRRTFRNWYQAGYGYVFAKFRCVM